MIKTLLKFCGITALAFSGIYILLFVIINIIIPYYYLTSDYIGVLIFALFSLITSFGGFLFLHYGDLEILVLKKKKEIILIWSIVLFFTTLMGGIIGFIIYVLLSEPLNNGRQISYVKELSELKRLLDDGLITKKEFEAKKKKILDI